MGQKSRKVENKVGSIVSELYVAELLLRGIVTSRNCYGPNEVMTECSILKKGGTDEERGRRREGGTHQERV